MNMHISASKKEKIYAVYLAKNKEIIEKVIRVNLKNLELEKNFENRRVDIYGISEDEKIEVFIELQLTKADRIHYEQIKKIIENVSDGDLKIIAWLAIEFDNDLLEELKEEIKTANKNIELVIIKINEKLIEKLEDLDALDDFSIVDNLEIINKIDNQFQVVYKYYFYDATKDIYHYVSFKVINKEENEKIKFLKKVIEMIRKESYYFLPVYHAKNIAGNKIVYGAGITSVIIQVGIDRWDVLYVEVVFDEQKIFERILSKKEIFDDVFDYRLVWDDVMYKVGVYMRFDENDMERQTKEVARIFDKLLKHIIQDIKRSVLEN